VKQGRWCGGPPPFGYKNISRGTLNYKGKAIKDIEIDESQAEVVRLIFRLYTKEHYGIRLIVKYLNDNGIKTHKGGTWAVGLISNILRQKIYIGVFELHKNVKNKPLVESPVMPSFIMIDGETFFAAQRLLSQAKKVNTNKGYRVTRHGQLLSGLLYCGDCGSKLTTYYSYNNYDRKNKPKPEWGKDYHYRCLTSEKFSKGCRRKIWNCANLDEIVIRHAKDFVLEIDKERLLRSNEDNATQRRTAAEKRLAETNRDIAKKQREIDKLSEEIVKSLLGESSFGKDDITKLLDGRKAERILLLEQQAQARAEIEEIDLELSVKKGITEGFDNWAYKFDIASHKDKKAMLLNTINRIEISEDGIKIQFKVELYPLKDLTPIDVKIPEAPFEVQGTASVGEYTARVRELSAFDGANNTVKRSITLRA
jgi:hypothetical protein